jgi:hypothetical protein
VNNTSAQLMREVSADHSLVSTNGKRFQHPDALAIEFLLDEHWCFALTTKISRRTSGRIKLAARQDMETRPISCFDLGSGD